MDDDEGSIRGALMCNSSTAIVLFHWAAGDDEPYPDSQHLPSVSRDPYEVLNWALEDQSLL
ncbi:hypothetical protein E4U55_007348 [Claviceps digitariae]|nr:hypothetical protein E4U55_007348 [Claviceps digitariae]